jgi:ribonuclease BN (tRNA processing enzyme)
MGEFAEAFAQEKPSYIVFPEIDYFLTVVVRFLEQQVPREGIKIVLLTADGKSAILMAQKWRRIAPSFRIRVIGSGNIFDGPPVPSPIVVASVEVFNQDPQDLSDCFAVIFMNVLGDQFATLQKIPSDVHPIFFHSSNSEDIDSILRSGDCFRLDLRQRVDIAIECLGAGGFFATDDAHTMCWFVPKLDILFDAGTGAFRIRQHRITSSVLNLFLSHPHFDHVNGINLLSSFAGIVKVHAEQWVIDAVRSLGPPFFPAIDNFEFRPIIAGEIVHLENGAVVESFALRHTCPCLGFRLEYKGKSMAYITDTCSTEDSPYLEKCKSVDLLVHEGYFTAEASGDFVMAKGHTASIDLARFCAKAEVKRLVICHLNPNGNGNQILSEIVPYFPKAELAQDKMVYEF